MPLSYGPDTSNSALYNGTGQPPTPVAALPIDTEHTFGVLTATGKRGVMTYQLFDDGDEVFTFQDTATGATSTQASMAGFEAGSVPTPQIVETPGLNWTDLVSGEIKDLIRRSVVVFDSTGGVDNANSGIFYYDASDGSDVTSGVVANGTIAENPVAVSTAEYPLVVTGAAFTLPPLQAYTKRVVVFPQVDSESTSGAGLAFTTNGVAPADANNFQQVSGTPITMSAQEAAQAVFAPLGTNAEINAGLTVEVTIKEDNGVT